MAPRKRFCSRNIHSTNLLNDKRGEDILPEFTGSQTSR